jgi:hypothetical protein
MGLPHSGNPVSYSRKEKVDSAAKMQSSKVKGEAEILRRRLLNAVQLRFRNLMWDKYFE